MAFAISRKTKILTVIVAILLFLGAGGLCGYLYWRSLPPQQFDYWPNTDSIEVCIRMRRAYEQHTESAP